MFHRREDGVYEFSRRFWIYTLIASVVIVWIGYRTQTAANKTEELSRETVAYAQQTNDCLNQLLATNRIRAQLNRDRDDLSEHQRLEILQMFQSLLDIPPDIASRDANDPVYRKWGFDVVRPYVLSIAADQKKVDDIKAELAAHPIPEPNCGLKLPGQ